MSSDDRPRRTVVRAACAWAVLQAAGGARGATPAGGQAPLEIGRVEGPSLLADVAERVMRMAFERAGRQAVFRGYPLLRSLALANDGVLDGDLGRIADAAAQYPQLIPLATPIARVEVAVFTPPGGRVPMTRERLLSMRVGSSRGVLIVRKYTRDLRLVETNSILQSLQLLQAHRVDAAVEVYVDALQLARANPALAGLAAQPQCLASEPLYCFLHHRHEALLPVLNDALRALRREGLIARLNEEALRAARVPPLGCGAPLAGAAPR